MKPNSCAMKPNSHSSLRVVPALFLLAVAVGVLFTACSGGKSDAKPQFPAVKQGNNLTLVVKNVQMKDAVYYQDTDFGIYTVTPSAPDHKLAAVLLQVFNGKANEVIMNVGTEGYILLDKPGNEYKSVNPFGPTRRLSPTLPNNSELIKFVWGPFTLQKDFSFEALSLFDVPANIVPNQIRWDTVETIFVPFYPIP